MMENQEVENQVENHEVSVKPQQEKIVEETLPVPNIKPETITQTKNKRSANQLAWSRELGKRSQEFKKKKQHRETLTKSDCKTMIKSDCETSSSLNGENSHCENPHRENPHCENSTSFHQSSYYLYYLLPVGILAGVYYFRNDIIMLTHRNSNTTKPEKPSNGIP